MRLDELEWKKLVWSLLVCHLSKYSGGLVEDKMLWGRNLGWPRGGEHGGDGRSFQGSPDPTPTCAGTGNRVRVPPHRSIYPSMCLLIISAHAHFSEVLTSSSVDDPPDVMSPCSSVRCSGSWTGTPRPTGKTPEGTTCFYLLYVCSPRLGCF